MELYLILISFLSSVFADLTSELLGEYIKKVCNDEPTCSVTAHQNIPANRRNFEGRNCLCDSECKQYKDCCVDSPHYKAEEQSPPMPYYCSPTKKVYMKIDCAPSWPDQLIVSKCQKSILPLQDDLTLITPITNTKNGITYGNIYCAICNYVFNVFNADDFRTWDLIAKCGQLPFRLVPPPPLPPPPPPPLLPPIDSSKIVFPLEVRYALPQVVPISRDYEIVLKGTLPETIEGLPKDGSIILDAYLWYVKSESDPATARMIRRASFPILITSDKTDTNGSLSDRVRHFRTKRTTSADIDFNLYSDEWDTIGANARYDPYYNLWISRYLEGEFVCDFEPKIPADDVPVRLCVPSVISTCSKLDNSLIAFSCSLRTAITYDKRGRAYRNKDCALCNGIREDELTTCP